MQARQDRKTSAACGAVRVSGRASERASERAGGRADGRAGGRAGERRRVYAPRLVRSTRVRAHRSLVRPLTRPLARPLACQTSATLFVSGAWRRRRWQRRRRRRRRRRANEQTKVAAMAAMQARRCAEANERAAKPRADEQRHQSAQSVFSWVWRRREQFVCASFLFFFVVVAFVFAVFHTKSKIDGERAR